MSDRHEMQAAGTHPAPCARHCESTAYEIEIRRLRHDIEHHVGIATEVTQELEQLRANFAALQHAIVGDTGASAILTAGRLRAELAASREREARMQWQPIEKAPKDGSLFLCWVYAVRYGETDDGQQYHQDVSQVDFCSWREGPSGLRDHGYFDPCCGQIADYQDVTHWMPLPASPRAALAEGAQG